MIFLDIESWIGGLGIGIILLGLLLLIIYIWAIIDILKRPFNSLLIKIIWIVIVISFPFVGVILYLIFGRRTSSPEKTRTRL